MDATIERLQYTVDFSKIEAKNRNANPIFIFPYKKLGVWEITNTDILECSLISVYFTFSKRTIVL